MTYLMIMALAFILEPESLLACSKHNLALETLNPKSATQILLDMLALMVISTPVGLAAGRTIRRLSPAFKKSAMVLAIAGSLTLAHHNGLACHGVETVKPILEKVYAAQMNYHKLHGVYAANFDDLGFAPASDQYSFFLPSQTLPAKKASPKEGVDLRHLPTGVVPAASPNAFTVVATAFAQPNRIDVWTMDHKKNFREWSLPAVRTAEAKPSADQPVSVTERISKVINNLEGPLTVMSLFLGVSLGLMLSLRARPGLTPAGL